MHTIVFTKHSSKQLKKIVSKNKVVNNVMREKFTTSLPQINLKEAVKLKKVKLVDGISAKVLNLLKENMFDPTIYEYRDFPKSLPFRVYFINRGGTFIILEILHHQKIKSKLAQLLIDTIRGNILKK